MHAKPNMPWAVASHEAIQEEYKEDAASIRRPWRANSSASRDSLTDSKYQQQARALIGKSADEGCFIELRSRHAGGIESADGALGEQCDDEAEESSLTQDSFTEALDRFEDNPKECRKLGRRIQSSKSFIICFGQSKNGELGLKAPNQGQIQNFPQSIPCPDDFGASSISSGSHHTALVTKSGEVFVCGSTLHGKLGMPDLQVTNVSKFTRLSSLKAQVRQVACGDYHTLALTDRGIVYSWGGSLHQKAHGGCEPGVVEALV